MSDSLVHRKRLATIVAIDVAGYSSRVENDETGALAEVAGLAELIKQTAEAFEGRVFNTAGDGFMLQFPGASDALQAADAIRDKAALPVRIGVHVGEVSVTPEGDLLGHGVNVAARLQARAMVGGILASDDVARAVRGDLSRRLQPAGRIKLDKMRETLEVYSFRPAGGAPGARPLRSVRAKTGPLIWLGLAALVVLALAAAWALHRPPSTLIVAASKPATLRLAASPIAILGAPDADLRKFAGGLQADMVGKMNQNRIDVLSPDQAASSAAYAFGGSVERDGTPCWSA